MWSTGRDHALMLITGTRVKMLKRATLMNDVKAWLLVSAMLAEVVAVGAVAVAVGEILRHG